MVVTAVRVDPQPHLVEQATTQAGRRVELEVCWARTRPNGRRDLTEDVQQRRNDEGREDDEHGARDPGLPPATLEVAVAFEDDPLRNIGHEQGISRSRRARNG